MMIIGMMLFVAGVAVGAVAGPMALPKLQARFPALAKATVMVAQHLPTETLRSKIAAAIAELEGQVRDRVDVERNMTRLAQLRDLIGGDQ